MTTQTHDRVRASRRPANDADALDRHRANTCSLAKVARRIGEGVFEKDVSPGLISLQEATDRFVTFGFGRLHAMVPARH